MSLSRALIPLLVILVAILLPLTTSYAQVEVLQIQPASLSITVDGNPSEWGTYDCTGKAPGLYLATVDGIPQWIWCDPEGDERTDFTGFGAPDPRVDLVQFRVTADENFVYGLVIVKNMDFANLGQNGATAVLITVNWNGTGTKEWFGLISDTNISPAAAWFRQIIINLGSAQLSGTQATIGLQDNWGKAFLVVNETWQFVTDAVSLMGADKAYNATEFKIAWSTIGGTPGGGQFYLRLGLITGRGYGNGTDYGDVWDIGGPGVSDALDCITTTGPNTWNEVQDGVVDYYIDLYFMTQPPYYPIPEPFIIPAIVAGISAGGIVYFIKKRKNAQD